MRITSTSTRPTTTGFLVQRLLARDIAAELTTLGSSHSGILLDVGCGNAPYSRLLPGWRRIGINIDAIDATPDVVGDGMALPFREGCTDAVLCSQVVEHVLDPFALVRELARVLRPGGTLILTGPMFWSLHEEPHDYWRFTEHGFRELCRRAGLEAVSVHPQGGAISLAAIVLNRIFQGPLFAPVRLANNLAALVLDQLIPLRHSTANLMLTARKPAKGMPARR
jgi:SAM-dependent methyltransferase